jgi:hypothetical protein
MQKGIGIISLVVGVILIVWAHNMAQSVGGQLQNVFTGSPGDKPMLLYICGGVLCATGAFQIFLRGK